MNIGDPIQLRRYNSRGAHLTRKAVVTGIYDKYILVEYSRSSTERTTKVRIATPITSKSEVTLKGNKWRVFINEHQYNNSSRIVLSTTPITEKLVELEEITNEYPAIQFAMQSELEYVFKRYYTKYKNKKR